MDVSIVIVSYNTSRILDECIVSIKRETTCLYEIIVVDNASADDSRRMLREKHPDVLLIENRDNAGFARANNQGFAIAQGKYFFMLNSDTVILDHAIDKLVEFMERSPDVGVCGPRNIGRDGKLQYSCDHFPSVWNTFCYYTNLGLLFPKSRLFNRCWMRYWDYGGPRDVERMTGCSLLIRSGLYRQLKGLDENFFMYFEETDFCFRAHNAGVRTTYFPQATIIHYGGESSKNCKDGKVIQTSSTNFMDSQCYYFRKNYGLVPMVAIYSLERLFSMRIVSKTKRMMRYAFRYSVSFMPEKINALNYKKTIDMISENKLSLIRWGDGETSVLYGYDIVYQDSTAELRQKMWDIVNKYRDKGIESGFLLAMPLKYLSLNGLDIFKMRLSHCWVHTRYLFKTSFNKNHKYGDAALFSESMNKYYEKLWHDASHIIFVHSDISCFTRFCATYNKNNQNTSFVKIPPKNCFSKYKEIEKEITDIVQNKRLDKKNTYILISAGPAAKVITFDLVQKGLICLDTGHCWDEPLSRDDLLA